VNARFSELSAGRAFRCKPAFYRFEKRVSNNKSSIYLHRMSKVDFLRRPKGVPGNSESTACAAETLYREGKLSSREIAGKLRISKSTLYSYLRHRGVPIGVYRALGNRRSNRRDEHA
jgi:hypothetical protein